MVLNRISTLVFLISLGVTACGEASFVGKGAKKSDPKSENTTPSTETPLIPGTGPSDPTAGTDKPGDPTPDPQTPGGTSPGPTTPSNPVVPGAPDGGDPTPDCVTQNGALIPCPEDPSKTPAQN